MKKVTIIIASIFCISLTSQAQVQFGFKGGANLSSVTGSDAGSLSSTINGYVGALVNIPVKNKFSLQAEAVYSMGGVKYGGGEVLGGSISTAYVNVPLLVHFNSNGFIIQSGPQMGLLMSASKKADKAGTTDVKDQLKSTNLSWVFGAGYTMPGSNVGFNVRYNLGLSNVNKDNSTVNHINVLEAGLFYMLGRK